MQAEIDEKNFQLQEKSSALDDSQSQVAKLKQVMKSGEGMIKANRKCSLLKLENLKFELEESEETRKVVLAVMADTKRELELAKSEITTKNFQLNELQSSLDGLKVFQKAKSVGISRKNCAGDITINSTEHRLESSRVQSCGLRSEIFGFG